MQIIKEITKKDMPIKVILDRSYKAAGWCFRVGLRAGILSAALFGLLIMAFMYDSTFQISMQEIAFSSNSKLEAGVSSWGQFIKSLFLFFCFILILYSALKTDYFEKLFSCIPRSYYRRFIKSKWKSSVSAYYSTIEKHVKFGLCALVVAGMLLVVFGTYQLRNDKVSSGEWPPKFEVVEADPKIMLLLPDGRKVVGAGFAMINKNKVELTFEAPVEPYE